MENEEYLFLVLLSPCEFNGNEKTLEILKGYSAIDAVQRLMGAFTGNYGLMVDIEGLVEFTDLGVVLSVAHCEGIEFKILNLGEFDG